MYQLCAGCCQSHSLPRFPRLSELHRDGRGQGRKDPGPQGPTLQTSLPRVLCQELGLWLRRKEAARESPPHSLWDSVPRGCISSQALASLHGPHFWALALPGVCCWSVVCLPPHTSGSFLLLPGWHTPARSDASGLLLL